MAPMRLCLPLAAALAVLAVLAAAPAHAGSLVFVKEGDVWVSAPDGSNARPVTTTGAFQRVFWSPSQADDGTIAAAQAQDIVVLRRSGEELARFRAPRLDDVHGSIQTPPRWVAISPDASRIAYAMTPDGCPAADQSCRFGGLVGVVSVTGTPIAVPGGPMVGGEPSWITNDRLLFHGGFDRDNMVRELSTGAAFNWFNDQAFQASPLALGEATSDGEVSADGRTYAAIMGFDEASRVVVYEVGGSIQAGPPPPLPTAVCSEEQGESRDPTLAGDGSQVWWERGDGIWTVPTAGGCAGGQRLLIPGASEPEWGPADPGAAAPAPPEMQQPDAVEPARKRCRQLKPKRRKACLKRLESKE